MDLGISTLTDDQLVELLQEAGVSLNWDGYRSELAANIRGLLTA